MRPELRTTMATGALNKVAVIGLGVMGRQVAWACASHGLHTIIFDLDRTAAVSAAAQITQWIGEDAGVNPPADFSLEVTSDLAEAVGHADLIFENIYEDA